MFKKITALTALTIISVSSLFGVALNASTVYPGDTIPADTQAFTGRTLAYDTTTRSGQTRTNYYDEVRNGSTIDMRLNRGYMTSFKSNSSGSAYGDVQNRDNYGSEYKVELGYNGTYVCRKQYTGWTAYGYHALCNGSSGKYANKTMDTMGTLTDEYDNDGSNYGILS